MSIFPEFAHLLTQYLAQHDRSPAWLARRLKVHPGTVSRWLNQRSRPATPELVIRVADALGVYTPAERQTLLAAAGFAYQEGSTTAIPNGVIAPKPLPEAKHQPESRSKLPVTSTSFVGREKELAQIAGLLADPAMRLITVVGLGGMGKSRLAVEAATRMLDQFVDGAWFVALAPVMSAGLIPAAIASALDIPLQGTIDLEAHVIRHLGDKRLLLILDNLEHLPEGIEFIERLLEGAPGVKVLATSRVRLRLDQEWLLPLDGLTLPLATDSSLLNLAEYTAVDLFVQRARRLQPNFTLSIENSAEVSRICQLVGGMPLAIELAAAWLRCVPLAEIAGEIQTSLDFLATSMRNEPERHHNMRAVFDHSWRLLDDDERHALMCVSVFRGGFTRQAATEVAGADLHTLSGLVDSSWLQLNAQGRYEIHELARQYAEGKLDAEPVTAHHARAAHCAFFATLAEQIGDLYETNDGRERHLKELVLELDNIWASWRWAAVNRDFDEIEKFSVVLSWLADAHGLYSKVVTEFEALCVLARKLLADLSIHEASYRQLTLHLAQLLIELCYLYTRAISVERGRSLGEEAVELLRQLGLDGRGGELAPSYLWALLTMSYVTMVHADYPQARLYADEVILLTRGKNEHLEFYAGALYHLGQVAHFQGNFVEAESLLTQCLAQSPDRHDCKAMDKMAHIYTELGNLQRAAQFAAAAVITAEEVGGQPDIASTLLAATEVALAQGHFEEVEKYLRRVYVIAEATGNRYVRVRYLNGEARLARHLGHPVEAQQLYSEAYELAKSMARYKDAAMAQIGLGFALLDEEKIEDAGAHLHAALQAAWERKIMPEVTWAVVGFAALEGYEGRPQIAERWLQSAIAHPACPKRVQVEAMEIRARLALADDYQTPHEGQLHDQHAALERVVLEILS